MIESIFEKKRPTWIDNQLNGKSAEENYQAFKKEQKIVEIIENAIEK